MMTIIGIALIVIPLAATLYALIRTIGWAEVRELLLIIAAILSVVVPVTVGALLIGGSIP